jgi:hypothetical protein
LSVELVELGGDVRAHIESRLTNGLTLSRLVRDRVGDWRCAVFVPEGTSPTQNLEHGGVVSATETEAAAASWIAERLAGATLVAENWVARPDDPAIERLRDVVAFGGEVYHVSKASPAPGDVAGTLREAQAAHGVAFFGVAGNARSPLEQLAARVLLVGVDAYDGETYAVAIPGWQQDRGY